MADLRIPIILNKGRKGIPLKKLASISAEIQQFLGLLGEDLNIELGAGWIGIDFSNGSLGFVAEKVDPVEELKEKEFKQVFRMPVFALLRSANMPRSLTLWMRKRRRSSAFRTPTLMDRAMSGAN
jgi:hypothetical protein